MSSAFPVADLQVPVRFAKKTGRGPVPLPFAIPIDSSLFPRKFLLAIDIGLVVFVQDTQLRLSSLLAKQLIGERSVTHF